MADEFVHRMEVEQSDLNKKIHALGVFLAGEKSLTLTPVERVLLNEQWHAMRNYARILQQRLEIYVGKGT